MDTTAETISTLQLEEILFLNEAKSNTNFKNKNCWQFIKLFLFFFIAKNFGCSFKPNIDSRQGKTQNLPMKSYEELFPNVNNATVSLKKMNQSVDALEGSILRKLLSSVDFREVRSSKIFEF